MSDHGPSESRAGPARETRDTQAAEEYVVNRYRRWQSWPDGYRYKHVKGARIAHIIGEARGSPPFVLELGVGPGGVAAAVSKRGHRIIGVDLSREALARAREHCAFDNVALVCASGFSLPFISQSLALIYASQVLHLFDSPERVSIMREVYRVLRPGGQFLFDMKNASSHPFRFMTSSAKRRTRNFPPRVEVTSLLHGVGFRAIDLRPGVLPMVGWVRVPNFALCRFLAHTTFFLATRPEGDGPGRS